MKGWRHDKEYDTAAERTTGKKLTFVATDTYSRFLSKERWNVKATWKFQRVLFQALLKKNENTYHLVKGLVVDLGFVLVSNSVMVFVLISLDNSDPIEKNLKTQPHITMSCI